MRRMWGAKQSLCCSVLSCVWLFVTLWTVPTRPSVHGHSPGKNTGVGHHALLRGIFPTQGSNPGLLHCRQILYQLSYQESLQSLNCVQLFATPWTAARQACLSITSSWSLLKLMSIKSMMASNCLILCHPLLFLCSFFPSIRVFSSESVLHIRWPEYWIFSFSIISFRCI